MVVAMVEARNDIRYEPASRANRCAGDALSSRSVHLRGGMTQLPYIVLEGHQPQVLRGQHRE
jgi:hypothetical protein